jgi:hypothetical protein
MSPTCVIDAECDAGHSCESGACVPVPTCQEDSECPEGKSCLYHICNVDPLPDFVCTIDSECGLNEICEAGECIVPVTPNEGCTQDSDCLPTEVCNTFTGFCEMPPEPVDPCKNGVFDLDETDVDCGGSCDACMPCTTDDNCAADQLCSPQGNCVPKPKSDPLPTPIERKSHLLSILLIFFGIAIMGGAGYFLYEQDLGKKEEEARQRAIAAQQAQQRGRGRQMPTDPVQLAKMREEQAARQAAMRSEIAKREAEKSSQRSSLFKSFDDSVEKSAPSKAAPGDTASSEAKKDDAVEGDDGYVEISALAKKGKKSSSTKSDDAGASKRSDSDKTTSKDTASKSKKTDKKSDDEAFDELDKLGK